MVMKWLLFMFGGIVVVGKCVLEMVVLVFMLGLCVVLVLFILVCVVCVWVLVMVRLGLLCSVLVISVLSWGLFSVVY